MNPSNPTQHQQARPLDFFITGTDTEVGKTLVASALVHTLKQTGLTVAGMKPVAAGAEWRAGCWHNEDVDALTAISSPGFDPRLINPYLFNDPVAPHLAAQAEGRVIDLDFILKACRQLSNQAKAVVVEGVGGFAVPLNDCHTTADLARLLQLPVVLVVGLRLGCINHALLTAQAIAAEGLPLAGWVANTVDSTMPLQQENIGTLRARLGAPFLGHIPRLAAADPVEAAGFIEWQLLLGDVPPPGLVS